LAIDKQFLLSVCPTRLIINDCLDSGTQLPYIRRAHAADWGVLVMNTNDLHLVRTHNIISSRKMSRFLNANYQNLRSI